MSEKTHSDLYKDRLHHSKEVRQAERRHELLSEQRKKRNGLCDENRSIEQSLHTQGKKCFLQKQRDNQLVKNQLQLSEWWMDRPDDFENWIIRPCPKGMRCLILAANGKTKAFTKRGGFMFQFYSDLPGCNRNKSSTTLLDCIFIKEISVFYVLDVLAYKDQDLRDCSASFRFYWIKSRIEDEGLGQVTRQNQKSFQWIESYECENENSLNTLMEKYPIWPTDVPQLDGILFYHKESEYVSGETPLVLWLFAFMLPEILFVPDLNEKYLADKPIDYTNYLAFIEDFNKKLSTKKAANRSRNKIEMELDDNEENNTLDVVKDQMNLELELLDDGCHEDVR